MKNDLLEEGDVIELTEGMCVYCDIPMHFIYKNKQGVWDLTHEAFVLREGFEYLMGRYVVTKAYYNGGGTGYMETIQDGWHVFCENKNGEQVDFYQTGGFTAMIPFIKPIAKSKLTWHNFS